MMLLRKYTHIHGENGVLYMRRWWIFNRYDKPWHIKWLPSIRLHHILVPDQDRHEHDHPWTFRTFVLKGWYIEQRGHRAYVRDRGYTGKLKHGQYHRIAAVAPGGVWTLFITFRKRSSWGFLVDGKHVDHREYLSNVDRD